MGTPRILSIATTAPMDPPSRVKAGSFPKAVFMAERAAVGRLLRKYADRPISLADACLVRLAELNDRASVLTIDSDFGVYRKHGRRVIPLIAPER